MDAADRGRPQRRGAGSEGWGAQGRGVLGCFEEGCCVVIRCKGEEEGQPVPCARTSMDVWQRACQLADGRIPPAAAGRLAAHSAGRRGVRAQQG